MDVLSLNFRILTYCGLWSQDNSSFVLLRRFWGLLIAINIFYFTFIQVIELYRLRNNVKELVDVIFLIVPYLLLCLKILSFNFGRKRIINLLENFCNKLCQSQSPEEELILQKYSMKVTKIFQNILGISQATGIFFCILPFVTLQPEDYVLPFKTFQFYDDTTTIGFFVTCVIQFVALIFGIFINVSIDTMIYGFIILSTSQFELISYRILRTTEENDKTLLRQCAIHHSFMNETVLQIQNAFFIGVIGPLFFFSLITLCTSIFQMAQNDIISLEFLGFAMYLSCMLCQVFLYCWYGNELNIKSLAVVGNIYNSNWILWDQREKKVLSLLMLSAQRGSIISWKRQCSLSLETFGWIMKTSYSVFNLLQHASDK